MGFFSIHIPEEETKGRVEARGLLKVIEGRIDESTIEEEMKYHFR